jgi:hypothetical protein
MSPTFFSNSTMFAWKAPSLAQSPLTFSECEHESENIWSARNILGNGLWRRRHKASTLHHNLEGHTVKLLKVNDTPRSGSVAFHVSPDG